MKIEDCIDFANENPICFLATAEENQPRVRALGFWFADKTGFYFQTSTTKNFYRHLKDNPLTEVCFYKHKDKDNGRIHYLYYRGNSKLC